MERLIKCAHRTKRTSVVHVPMIPPFPSIYTITDEPDAESKDIENQIITLYSNNESGGILLKPPSLSKDTEDRTSSQEVGATPHWSYAHPSAWPKLYPSCRGTAQSPVNIDPAKSHLRNDWKRFTLGNYEREISKMVLTNNGHTVVFELPARFPYAKIPYVRNGGLAHQYTFCSFHFHWGDNSRYGSEHKIRFKDYAAELHIVHYNTRCGAFSKATRNPDGLAIFAVHLKVGPEDNPHYKPIIAQLKDVRQEGDRTTLKHSVQLKDLLPSNITSFYRYHGSTTTPSCDQIVTWTIFDHPVAVSEKQMAEFRKLTTKDGSLLVNNHRPLQPLNGRAITYGCTVPRKFSFFSLRSIMDYLRWKERVLNHYFNVIWGALSSHY